MIVNGDALTAHEKFLLDVGDVTDVDHLRDLSALRRLQEECSVLGRYRLQKQIEALENAAITAAVVITQAKR